MTSEQRNYPRPSPALPASARLMYVENHCQQMTFTDIAAELSTIFPVLRRLEEAAYLCATAIGEETRS